MTGRSVDENLAAEIGIHLVQVADHPRVAISQDSRTRLSGQDRKCQSRYTGSCAFVLENCFDPAICLIGKSSILAVHSGPKCERGQAECENRDRSEEHTSELQSLRHLVCRL